MLTTSTFAPLQILGNEQPYQLGNLMNNEMTPQQALQILSDATEPQAAGKISRQGYLSIQKALETIAALIPKEEEPQPSE